MKNLSLMTLIALCLVTQGAEAALRYDTVKSSHLVNRSAQHHIQQHYSFISEHKPSAVMQELRAPLTGRVQHRENITVPLATLPMLPLSTAPSVTSVSPAFQQKARHFTWFTPQKPVKLRVVPDIPTAQNSWVSPLSLQDAYQLSGILTDMIHTQVPESEKSLILMAVPVSQTSNSLTLNLRNALTTLGYNITTPSNTATQVLYRVTPLDHALFVSLRINNSQSARLYARSQSGALTAASPLTVSPRSSEQ